jgi:hypothetical protein
MTMLTPHLRLNILPPHQTALQAALWACAGSLGLVFAYSCSCNLLLFAPSIYLVCTENLIRVADVMESPKLAE